eukprot:1150333-Pelagomonas_calceolata.AAC.1
MPCPHAAKNEEDQEGTAAARQGDESNWEGSPADSHDGESRAAAGHGADSSKCVEAGVLVKGPYAVHENMRGTSKGVGASEEKADDAAIGKSTAAVQPEEQKQQAGQQHASLHVHLSVPHQDKTSKQHDGQALSQEALPDQPQQQQQQPLTPLPINQAKPHQQAKGKPTSKASGRGVTSSPSLSQPSRPQPPSPHSVAPYSLPHTPRSPPLGSGSRKGSARAAYQDQLPSTPQPLPNHGFFEGMPPPI